MYTTVGQRLAILRSLSFPTTATPGDLRTVRVMPGGPQPTYALPTPVATVTPACRTFLFFPPESALTSAQLLEQGVAAVETGYVTCGVAKTTAAHWHPLAKGFPDRAQIIVYQYSGSLSSPSLPAKTIQRAILWSGYWYSIPPQAAY